MLGIVLYAVFGIVVGWLTASFMEGRGGLGPMWSVVVGMIGSIAGGFLFSIIGKILVGEGPDFLVPLVAAPVVALVSILLINMVKR